MESLSDSFAPQRDRDRLPESSTARTAKVIRFHLDQHVAGRLANALKRRGIDVTATAAAGLQDASDDEHIAFALAQNRVIVTQDRDFLVRHSEGARHAGICYCHQQTRTTSELLDILVLMNECFESEDMHGQVEYL